MDESRRVTADDRKQALAGIAAEIAVCTLCPLHVGRTLAVPGEGHPDTEVVFVGEGPGYNEDREGRPFIGAAGGILNEMLKAIGWRREEVFITNVVKCRPPGNRDPEPFEIAACGPYLKRQLAVLDPAVVVTLGRHSLSTFMPGERISSTHGTARPTSPETGAAHATTYAMYHPAAALRQGSLKETMLVDMAGLPEVLIQSRERRAAANGAAAKPTNPVAPAFVPEPAVLPVHATAVVPGIAPDLAIEAPITPAALEAPAMPAPAPGATEPQLELFR